VSLITGLNGTLGGIVPGDPIGGIIKGATSKVAGLGLNAISSWVLNGTKAALQQVADLIGTATSPNLQSTWFSSTYWRVAALSALLTVPFLCAAAVQAVARADLALLGKVAFGYLPLSAIGVSLAAPLTMLLLAATDQMSRVVSATAVNGGAHFLDQAADAAGTLSALNGSPFFAVMVGLFAVMAALALALELIVREAAVYVVVLMLPLAFAALVWPARRIWAARLVELLVSLILSKFVIVAVLSLAAAAFAADNTGTSQLLTAMALLLLSTFAPWALMRLLPFTELAAGAAGMLRHELPHASSRALGLAPMADGASELAMSLPARLRQHATDVDGAPTPDAPLSRSGFGSASEQPLGSAGSASAATEPTAASAASSTTTEFASATPSGDDGGGERLPGMDPIWQAQNDEWPEIKRLDAEFLRNGIDYSPPTDTAETEDQA
jgi:hypothetical protein